MNKDIRLRQAVETDVAAVGDLTVSAYVEAGHLSADSPYQRTLRNVRPRLDATLVATMGDRIVGAVAVMPAGHRFAEISRPGEWEFRFLAVSGTAWGKGVGRALVAAAEQRARDAGAEAMMLFVIDINTRAQELYARLGYARVSERDWSPESEAGSVNLLAYRRLL